MSDNNKKYAALHYSSQEKTNKKYHKGALLTFSGMIFYLGHILQQAQARSLSRDQIIESDDSLRLEDNEANLQLVDHQDELLAEDELLTQLDSQSLESSAISLVMLDDASQLNFEDDILQAEGAITGSSHSSISQLLVPVASEEAAKASTDAAASASSSGFSSAWTLGWGALAVAGVTLASGDSDDSGDDSYDVSLVEVDQSSVSVTLDGAALPGGTLSAVAVVQDSEGEVAEAEVASESIVITDVNWFKGDDPSTVEVEQDTLIQSGGDLLMTEDLANYKISATGTYTVDSGVAVAFETGLTNPGDYYFLVDLDADNEILSKNPGWYVVDVEYVNAAGDSNVAPAYVIGEFADESNYFDEQLVTMQTAVPYQVSAGDRLSFEASYDTESPGGMENGYDGFNFAVSDNEGQTWNYVESDIHPYTFIIHDHLDGDSVQQGWAGSSDGFESISVPLDSYAGHDVDFQFTFFSDNNSGGSGVKIVNFEIINSGGVVVVHDDIGTENQLFELAPFAHLNGLAVQVWEDATLIGMDLSGQGLDSLPDSLGDVVQLESLDISYNSFTALPDSLALLSHLKTLSAGGNDFSALNDQGVSSVWVGVLGLSSALETLNLYGASIAGDIPDSLDVQFPNLSTLNLGYNDLVSLPSDLSGFLSLEHFYLSYNDFATVPLEEGQTHLPVWDALFTLPGSLIELDVSNNSLVSLPDDLSGFQSLETFNVRSNDFGSVPLEEGQPHHLVWDSIFTLSDSLIKLNLGNNDLTGHIPGDLNALAFPNLDYLRLSFNDIDGPISAELGSFTELYYLSLHGNNLSGSIPPEIGNLIELKYLFLSQNELSGDVPLTLLNLLKSNGGSLESGYFYSQTGDLNGDGVFDELNWSVDDGTGTNTTVDIAAQFSDEVDNFII